MSPEHQVEPKPAMDEPTTPATEPQSRYKAIRVAVVGTVIEYYDFSIYGFMATTIAALFFVKENDTAALLGTFAAFAVAFFLRVPGGILFGHIGDKYGRKRALTWTILLMVIATTVMGLLPTYATVGLWATTALVLARCLQGIAAGGELGGANVFVAESAPVRWRATQTSMVNSGTYIGSLVASLVALGINSAFSEEQVLDWAWRIPFLLSLVLGVVGIWIRKNMHDTPQFMQLDEGGETKKSPFRELISTSWVQVVQVALLSSFTSGGYYISSIYVVSYLQTEGDHSARVAFMSASIALVIGIPLLPLSGYLADTFGRKKVIFFGAAAGAILAFPMFSLMSGHGILPAIFAQTVLFACFTMVNGAAFVTFAELFKASIRYSGLALGNNISAMVIGGTAPLIATYLIDVTGSGLAPAGYFAFCATLTLITVLTIKETKRTELTVG